MCGNLLSQEAEQLGVMVGGCGVGIGTDLREIGKEPRLLIG